MQSSGSGTTVSRGRWLAALLVLSGALPVLGTIWTRSTNIMKVPRGTREVLPNTAYFTRDWNVAVTAVEVKDDPAPTADMSQPRWVFYYKNTDSEPHYVSITVLCQDIQRKDRARFSYTATLVPNRKEDFPLEISSKIRTPDWKQTVIVKITVDFLSTPSG